MTDDANIYAVPGAPDIRRRFARTVLIIAAVELAIVAGICLAFGLTSLAEVSTAVIIGGAACAALAVLPLLVPKGSIMPMGNYGMSADSARIGQTEEVRSLARQDALDLRRDRGKMLAVLAGSGMVILIGIVLGLLS